MVPGDSLWLLLAALLGRGGVGIQARWDGILAGSLGSVVSVGVVLTLD